MRNIEKKLYDLLQVTNFSERYSKGEVFDATLEFVMSITKILKKSGLEQADLVRLFGLCSDVRSGLPGDSEAILAYSMSVNICDKLFDEKFCEGIYDCGKITNNIEESPSNVYPFEPQN
tara:strand:- start:120 stop:476 length:357 start_codon:yes stop_codon:yes gene_type:complete